MVDQTVDRRTALLAGGTGLVGGHVLDLLLADAAYGAVTSIVRRPTGKSHPKLEERVVDFDRLGDGLGSRDVFCCLGTTIKKAGSEAAFRRVDHDYVTLLARRARDQGAEQFLLVSSIGADAASGNFYLRVKGETEAAVADLGYPGFHVFRPSLLVGERQEHRRGEKLGIAGARLLDPLMALAKPLRRYRAIPAATVAAAMVAAAKAGDPGRHVHTHGEIQRLAAKGG